MLTKSVKAAHKPNFVSETGLHGSSNDHSSRMTVARHLMRPTRKLERAILSRFPIWSCTGWGLPSFPGHPENWCALTAPFHPYLVLFRAPGGILSVALSFASPRLHVMEHPALWCSDFPPAPQHGASDRLIYSDRYSHSCSCQ